VQNVSSSKGPTCCANTHLKAPAKLHMWDRWRNTERGTSTSSFCSRNSEDKTCDQTVRLSRGRPPFRCSSYTAGTPCLITPERRTGARGKLPRHHMCMPLEKTKFGTIPVFHVSTQIEGRSRSRIRGFRRNVRCRTKAVCRGNCAEHLEACRGWNDYRADVSEVFHPGESVPDSLRLGPGCSKTRRSGLRI